jgi:hypothetical protein
VPPPSEIPPGPSFFGFADEAAFGALLVNGGFVDVEIGTATFDFSLRTADEVIAALAEGTVRTGALVRAADDSQRSRIRESLERRLAPWQCDDGYAVPASVRIARGSKPD